jgi:molecular chaperone GrpE (heat shock protein)
MVLPCEKEDEKRLEDEAQRDLAHDNQVDQNGDWRRVIGELEEELDSLYKEMNRMRADMQECGCEAEREKWSGQS